MRMIITKLIVGIMGFVIGFGVSVEFIVKPFYPRSPDWLLWVSLVQDTLFGILGAWLHLRWCRWMDIHWPKDNGREVKGQWVALDYPRNGREDN